MSKKILMIVMSLLIIVTGFSFSPRVKAGTLPTTPDKDNPDNIHYFVGLYSTDIWRRSDGATWTGEGRPGGPVNIPFPYSFDFPDRKIKSVKVSPFKSPGDWDNGLAIWERSRYYQVDWLDTSTAMSNNFHSNILGNVSGIGTSSVSFTVQVTGTLTTSRDGNAGKNITSESNEPLDPGVIGYRYYFPSMLTIELEPKETGKAFIKHFTTDMKSLNGVAGFKDYELPLETNKNYDFSHTPGTAAYEYKGWEKSTVGTPTGSNIEQGDPYSLNPYTGGFNYHINYYYKTDQTPPPDPVGKCTVPQPASEITGSVMDPAVSGVIKADSRGSERFNVLDGIPTSESLYGNVLAKTYLYKDKFVQMTGTCTYEVVVNREYTLKWDPKKKETGPDGKEKEVPDPQEETETLTQTHTIERPYSFWTIDNLEVYKIDQAKLWNYAFDAGGIQLQPTGYNAPYYATSKSSSYTPPESPGTVDAPPGSKSGGKERPDISGENLKSFAEAAIDPVKVKNDTLTFNGQTIMNGTEASQSGPTPGQIPSPAQIGNNVLYSPGNVVPTSKTNKANQASTGTIYYGLMSGNINGGSDQSYPIYGINSVTVHTPVVIYPAVSDDKAHNQKTKPAAGRSAIILDRPFTVEMPNSGQHTNYLGYGNRNYLKYIGSKQVRFPFDVYDDARTTFYPKNTWIEVDKTGESFTFFLPVWVDEGFYDVEFRTIAHNAPSGATHQENANLNLVNHIAYDTVPVDAIGRVYDFRITDIADFNWETVFRTKKGSSTPTGASYWIGLNGIDGAPRGNAERYTLPIRLGSHPVYKNVAIKTGYHYKFEFKTKGNMMDKLDGVKITPTFYFVTKDGKTRVPVDLYYHTSTKNFVKVGSKDDKVERYVILNDRLRNVSASELTDTASYKYDKYLTPAQQSAQTKVQYTNTYINKYTKQKTPVGWFRLLMLPEQLRTFIGPKSGLPSGVNNQRANASVQRWYGEYSLPAAPYVVQKDLNIAEWGRTHGGLDDKSPIFLKTGYIIVNFNIETIQDGDTANPYLQYINAPAMKPTGSQWELEGFKSLIKDSYGHQFTLQQGDVVFYNANESSYDDFHSTVPH